MSEYRDEFLAACAKRLRAHRKSLGFETAASFARAIGYPPDRYSRYERVGFTRQTPLLALLKAIDVAGFGFVSIDWLFSGNPAGKPPSLFDPDQWLAHADMIGFKPLLITQPDGSTGLCISTSPPPTDRLIADALHYAISPTNRTGDANRQALADHMRNVGRHVVCDPAEPD